MQINEMARREKEAQVCLRVMNETKYNKTRVRYYTKMLKDTT